MGARDEGRPGMAGARGPGRSPAGPLASGSAAIPAAPHAKEAAMPKLSDSQLVILAAAAKGKQMFQVGESCPNWR